MVKRGPDPKLLGLFVMGAVVLLGVSLVAFGRGHWWRAKNQFVLYFEESVRGLSVGAPVMFRGVRIGSVGDIRIQLNGPEGDIHVPVIIDVDSQPEIDTREQFAGCADTPACLAELVERGMRARLQIQSLVTGQLMVEFDFFPGMPAAYGSDSNLGITQLPTIPSGLEEISRAVRRIPLEKVINEGMRVLEGVERLVNNPQTREAFKNLNQTLLDVQRLVHKAETEVEGLGRSLNGAAAEIEQTAVYLRENLPVLAGELNATLDDIQALVANADKGLEPMGAGLASLVEQSQRTLLEAEHAFRDVDTMIRDDGQFRLALERSLTELSGTLRAVRGLAEYLQQYPDALLRGKRTPKGSK